MNERNFYVQYIGDKNRSFGNLIFSIDKIYFIANDSNKIEFSLTWDEFEYNWGFHIEDLQSTLVDFITIIDGKSAKYKCLLVENSLSDITKTITEFRLTRYKLHIGGIESRSSNLLHKECIAESSFQNSISRGIDTEEESVKSILNYEDSIWSVKELARIVEKYGYDIDEESGPVMVFKFLAGVLTADNASEYISQEYDNYNEIIALLEHEDVSQDLIDCLDDLLDEAYRGYTIDDEIIELLEQIYDEICDKTHTNYYERKYKYSESKQSVQRLIDSAKSELTKERKQAYYSVLDYIKSQKHPVTKKMIKHNVKLATDNAIRSVLYNEDKIVKLRGEYMWYDNLGITRSDEWWIIDVVDEIVEDALPHHIQEVYDELYSQDEGLMKRMLVTSPNRLAGLLRALPEFNARFTFEQPYIAQLFVSIVSPKEKLKTYIKDLDRVLVADILKYARDNFMHVNRITELLNSLNKTHIFLNKYELVNLKKINVGDEIIVELTRKLKRELHMNEGTMAICQVNCANELPAIGIEWNEWLIYSLMLKNVKDINVFLSSNIYKEAIPMISIYDNPNTEEVANIAEMCKNRSLRIADNMNNIDDLLEDIIDDFIEDIEF